MPNEIDELKVLREKYLLEGDVLSEKLVSIIIFEKEGE